MFIGLSAAVEKPSLAHIARRFAVVKSHAFRKRR
jgi:hypothetical protein